MTCKGMDGVMGGSLHLKLWNWGDVQLRAMLEGWGSCSLADAGKTND